MEHDITLVNSGTVVVANFDVIDSHLPDVLYANGKESATFDLETKGWYNGSVVNFEISCSPDPDACGEDITIRNAVWENEEWNPKAEDDVIDMIDSDDHIYILASDPADLDNYLIKEISNDLLTRETRIFNTIDSKKGEFECLFLTPAHNDEGEMEYLITICYDYKLDTWATLKVFDIHIVASDGEPEPPIV
jgi:hypothetical protein